ncbi:hypothetical protein PVAP13_1NG221395 [Panicum virgatum]|uniref:Band 7 domain-containing protein n=1 Tax=Panicum virgatum TaxID=38727 RepID=A0A8T0WYX9_PANVG|nr:hypothetical protein PVAP13_1NG221395 [Panicum virgatum]
MASLHRRSAAPARQLLLLPRHLAAAGAGSAPASSCSFSRFHPRDDSSMFDPPEPPVNWGVSIVPEKKAFVVERTPITKDNVTIQIDSVIYVKIMDPDLASYGVENPIYAVLQLAQTTMRSELWKITLDKTFEERDALNEKIVPPQNWGLKCIRYEIRDITPPTGIKQAMEMQAEAERRKRVQIFESEGKKQAQILESEGKKTAQILESEGAMLDVANRAKGAAEAFLAKSEATARGMRLVSEAMASEGSAKAANLKLAEQYIEAFSNLAQKAMKTYQQIHSHSQALKSHPQVEELEESQSATLIEEADSNQAFMLQRPILWFLNRF